MEDEQSGFKADKRDYAIAKYMHNNVPKRIGDLHGMEVECFFAEEAVNALLDSQWATGKDCIFTDRQSVVDYCHVLLCKEMYHRATLAKRKPKPAKASVTDGNETPGESGTEGKKKKSKKSKDEVAEGAPGDKPAVDEPKKVKKLKLEMCDDQSFHDGREVYVWIYEPVSWTKALIGTGILVGAILICCYPLWPEWMRIVVYYLSLCAAGFLGVIISLAILRYIVWGIIYGLTMGKHSFFLFPNLTEDCGFFESFVPLFEYEDMTKPKNSKSKKSDPDSPSESKTEEKSDEPVADTETPGGDGGTDQAEGADEGSDKSRSSSENDFEVIKTSELSS